MSTFVDDILDAHGGLDRWRSIYHGPREAASRRCAWGLGGQGRQFSMAWLLRYRRIASGHPMRHSARERPVRTLRANVSRCWMPRGRSWRRWTVQRASFEGHSLESPWNDIQLAFFRRAARCGRISIRHSFWHGEGVHAEDERHLGGERRDMAEEVNALPRTRSKSSARAQAIYVGPDKLVRRLDYDVEIARKHARRALRRRLHRCIGHPYPDPATIYPRLADVDVIGPNRWSFPSSSAAASSCADPRSSLSEQAPWGGDPGNV